MQCYSMSIDHDESFTSLFEQGDSFLLLFLVVLLQEKLQKFTKKELEFMILKVI